MVKWSHINTQQEITRVFKSLFKEKIYATRTFTYYIPAPPSRKTGYQEREFDAIIDYVTSLGFKILDFKLQSHSDGERGGLWVLCFLAAPTKEIYYKKINFSEPNIYKNNPNNELDIPLDSSINHDL